MTMSKTVNGVQHNPGASFIGGKKFAGGLVDARPCFQFGTTKDRRTITGFLRRDFKNRGFDGCEVRTSVVEDLIVHEGAFYAITMNSAYRLDTVCMMAFLLGGDAWVEDFKIMIQGVGQEENEPGIISTSVGTTYHVTPEYFAETAKRLSVGEWQQTHENATKRTLQIGSDLYVEEKQ